MGLRGVLPVWRQPSRVTTRIAARRGLFGCGGEVVEAGWLGDLEGLQDAPVARCELAALGDVAGVGGQCDEMEAFQLASDVAGVHAFSRRRPWALVLLRLANEWLGSDVAPSLRVLERSVAER